MKAKESDARAAQSRADANYARAREAVSRGDFDAAKSHRLLANADENVADGYLSQARQLRASLISGGSGGRANTGGESVSAASAAARIVMRWYRLVRCRRRRLGKLVPFGACGSAYSGCVACGGCVSQSRAYMHRNMVCPMFMLLSQWCLCHRAIPVPR